MPRYVPLDEWWKQYAAEQAHSRGNSYGISRSRHLEQNAALEHVPDLPEDQQMPEIERVIRLLQAKWREEDRAYKKKDLPHGRPSGAGRRSAGRGRSPQTDR